MFPGMDPTKMDKLLKQLGITAEEIEAKEVIIKTPSGEVKIEEPQVIKTKIKGQIIFQVTGKVSEEPFSQEDIKIIKEETGIEDEELIKEALRATNGDIVEAIVKLKEKK